MTPGFGKPRSELPWLPYESLDRVTINAHNFAPAINLKTDLVWWWDLAAANATITDQQSGLVLTRTGTTTTAATGGPDGGPCIDFGVTGNNKYVNSSVPKTVSYDDGFTVNIWVRSTSASTGNWIINHRGLGSGNSLYFHLPNAQSGTDNAVVFDNAVNFRVASASSGAFNVWHMLTLIDTGAVTNIYRNASLVGTASTSLGARSTGSAPFAIGGNSWSVNPPLDHRGRLAMAGVWNAPLSAAAIIDLYNGGAGKRYATL